MFFDKVTKYRSLSIRVPQPIRERQNTPCAAAVVLFHALAPFMLDAANDCFPPLGAIRTLTKTAILQLQRMAARSALPTFILRKCCAMDE